VSLRTPIPTLEPDDAFVARLSALAAASAAEPEVAGRPVGTWRVALAAAGVAAVLVGAAWLTGLGPTGSPQPAPGPATTPSAPETPPPSVAPTPGSPTPVDRSQRAPIAATPDRTPDPADPNTTGPDTTGQNTTGQGTTAGTGNQGQDTDRRGRGPNEHAGDHPNEHATTTSNHGHPNPGDKPGRGPRSQAHR
jgi:hypothetical protein